ncbi:MAG: HD-GYP domain-containing protein [Niameybacter sp.]
MKQLSVQQKRFFISIYGIAFALLIFILYKGYMTLNIKSIEVLCFFILITGITESITLYFKKLSFSTTFAITLATYILLGPMETLIISLGGFLIRVLKIDEDTYKHIFNTPFYGTCFNCSMYMISFIGAHLLAVGMGSMNSSTMGIAPLIGFSVAYFIINKFILAVFKKVYSGQDLWYCLMEDFWLGLINYMIMIPFGIIFVQLYETYSYWGIIFTLFPVLLVKYTFTYYAEAKNQYNLTVETLMNAMDARDKYTQGHSFRVAQLSVLLAEELGYRSGQVEKLRIAAMLHDVGKIGVSDKILHKPGGLTEEEYNIIKTHPVIGENIIKAIKHLDYTRSIIRNHHERYDGLGYPDGRKGDELELDVYIVQLADTVDAMGSDRPYRKGLAKEVIHAEVAKYAGTQFHPKVANAYLNGVEKSEKMDKIWE